MESLEKHIKKLSKILGGQYNLYGKVFDLIKAETNILINANLDALTGNLQMQQVFLAQINKLEKNRIEEMEIISIFLGANPVGLKLAYVAANAPGEYSKILSSQEVKFKSLMEEIIKLNKSNKFLINNSLQYLDKNIQAFFGCIKETGLYSKPNRSLKKKKMASSLLDRRA